MTFRALRPTWDDSRSIASCALPACHRRKCPPDTLIDHGMVLRSFAARIEYAPMPTSRTLVPRRRARSRPTLLEIAQPLCEGSMPTGGCSIEQGTGERSIGLTRILHPDQGRSNPYENRFRSTLFSFHRRRQAKPNGLRA